MAPMWVNLYLAGEPSSLPEQDPRLDIEGAEPDRLAEVERRWTGADRRNDHGFWASRAGADTFLVADEDGPLAVGDAHDIPGSGRRSLGRLVIRPGADPVSATIAALHRAGRRGQVRVTMLGPNPALRLLLDHGFRIVEHDQAMASEPDLMDPLHLLPNSALLLIGQPLTGAGRGGHRAMRAPTRPGRQSTAYRSIGTPTIEPHSVHDPS